MRKLLIAASAVMAAGIIPAVPASADTPTGPCSGKQPMETGQLTPCGACTGRTLDWNICYWGHPIAPPAENPLQGICNTTGACTVPGR